ncbi:MAG: RNA polymerase factor sigma-54 [Lawsonibacter sp.]|jgi:RNA polymerase sigma-54 factor
MELTQTQQLQQRLSPQMIQGMHVLQMGLLELREYVYEQLQDNPMLEVAEEDRRNAESGEEYPSVELDWGGSSRGDVRYRGTSQPWDGRESGEAVYQGEDGLSAYLLSQFEGLGLDKEMMRGIQFLVCQLDDYGWIEEEPQMLAQQSGISEKVIWRALTELQAAEPAGVGARNLRDCLRLQIERHKGDHRLPVLIAERYLEDVAKNRFGHIARCTGASEQAVRSACALIRTLTPRPSTGFPDGERTIYLIPDLYLKGKRNKLQVYENDAFVPSLCLNQVYLRMLEETEDQETEQYLQEKMEQAKWVMHNLERRRRNLMRCMQIIVERQNEFFQDPGGTLQPLSMEEVAKEMGVHPSTVSRTVHNKFIQCPKGIYPITFFFARAIGDGKQSSEEARTVLRQLIEAEDRPLSDQELSERLKERGYVVARRTVAKYREELGILTAAGRK